MLTHEFTHALVQSVARRGVPFWLHEGLAVLFEGSDLAKKDNQVRDARVRIPLSRLERSFAGLSGADASLAYAESAIAARALVDQAGAAGVLNLLDDLGRGAAFADAFEKHAFVSYAEFQKKLQD